MRIPKTIDTLYIAKDKTGIHAFIDFPDLLKINTEYEPIWTGYCFDFYKYRELQYYIINMPRVKLLKELETPLIIKITKNKITII